MANLISGVLFSGPPSFNTLFGGFRDHRQPGSPEIQSVYQDGQIVRFTNDPATGIPPKGQPWNGTRVLYLLHPSDPVVWWSPDLISSRPRPLNTTEFVDGWNAVLRPAGITPEELATLRG